MYGTEFARISGKYSTIFIGTYQVTGQSTSGNYSNFKIRVYGYYGGGTSTGSSYGTIWISGTQYNIGGYRLYPGYTLMAEKDITIYHNNDGSFPYTTQAFAINSYHANGEVSGAIYAPTIARYATITNATDFNDENNPTITYSNPAGNSVSELKAGIYDTAGNVCYVEYKDVNKTGSSFTFNLSENERNNLRKAIVNSNSLRVRFYLRTTIGGNQYFSYVEKTMTIVNANPKFTLFDFEDVNTKTLALTGNKLNVIKGYSNVKATIKSANKAVAQKYATMSKYRFACGDKSTDITYSASTDVNGTINGVTNGTFNVYAIDSRNNSTLVTKLANKIVDYKPLEKGNITVNRNNGVSEEVTLKINGKIDSVNFGAKTNSITYSKYRYKATKTPNWSEYQDLKLTVKDGVFTFDGLIKGDTEELGFDINNSYQIELLVKDELSEVTFTATFSSGIPDIALHKNGVGIMGKYDEDEGGLLQVGGKDILKKDIAFAYSSESIYTSFTEWVDKKINLNAAIVLGDKFEWDSSNNRINVIGDVSYLKITASYNWYNTELAGDKVLKIYKNGVFAWQFAYVNYVGDYYCSMFGQAVLQAQKGDYFEMYVVSGASGTTRTFSQSSGMLIEAIE